MLAQRHFLPYHSSPPIDFPSCNFGGQGGSAAHPVESDGMPVSSRRVPAISVVRPGVP
jgi:hypothetical protein